MCTAEKALEENLRGRFYKKLTIGELKQLGFQREVHLSDKSTVLMSKSAFFWAYPEVLDEIEHESGLFDALEKPYHDGKSWCVVANGIMGEGDVFPFAIFVLNAPEKPIERTTAAVREMEVPEELRERFEHGVFAARFIGSIQRTGKGGPLELMSIGCPTKADLMARSEDGSDYTDETVSAMWFGFKLSLRESQHRK